MDLFPPRCRANLLTDLDGQISRTISKFWCSVNQLVSMTISTIDIIIIIHVSAKLASHDIT